MKILSLSLESRKLIDGFVQSNNLGKENVYELFHAHTKKDIQKVLQDFKRIDAERIEKIWHYVRNKIWSCDEPNSTFDGSKCIFFEQLLRNKGVIFKKDYKFSKVINSYKLERVTEALEDVEIIIIIKLNNGEAVYMLDLSFYDEVFK